MIFSILIANYNNGHFIHDCFASILNQSYQDFEVIIVDDASTDNSVAVIEQLIRDDKRFKLYHNDKNRGCGYTKRRCVELATGDVCGFVDPDDAIVADAIETMVMVHQKHEDASIVSSKYYFTDLNLTITKACAHGEKIPENTSYLVYGNGAITHFATFKMDCYRKSLGLNPSYKRAVDQDLYYLLEEQGKTVFVDRFLYLYRIQKNSISANQNEFKAKYWHYKAQYDAYIRRKKMSITSYNLTRFQIQHLKEEFLINRMQYETKQQHYSKKYYFLFLSLINLPFYHLKYKMLCFFKMDYC